MDPPLTNLYFVSLNMFQGPSTLTNLYFQLFCRLNAVRIVKENIEISLHEILSENRLKMSSNHIFFDVFFNISERFEYFWKRFFAINLLFNEEFKENI